MKSLQVGGDRAGGETILILGGGTGGVVAANRLRKLLDRKHRIVVIDRQSEHLFAASYLWLMLGMRRPEQIRRPLTRLVRKGIEFLQADVENLDLSGRCVRTNAGDLFYDHLLLALGAETAVAAVPGLAETGHNLYTLDGATRLRDAVQAFRGGHIVLLVARLPYKCPAAPYESALLLEGFFRQRGLRNQVDISVYVPEPQPLPVAGPELGQAVSGLLARRGIGYFPQWHVRRVDPNGRCIILENDTAVPFDLLVTVPPHHSPKVVRESGLVDESGWVPVDPGTLETKVPGVYAVGDVTAIKLPNGMMLPKAGVFAHHQAEVVAHNIAATIHGRPAQRRFDGYGFCFLEIGQGAAGRAAGNFYAEPHPVVRLQKPGRFWHWGKVAFEKWWLWRWF
jgi:sulfide:quinone oxidoreductase